MNPQYKPRNKRVIDTQYVSHIRHIREHGEYTKHPHQAVGRKVVLDLPPLVFDLANGFPLVTERYMPFSKSLAPIGEMLAFIHGAHTQEEMVAWGCKWWRIWTTPEKCSVFGLPPGEMGQGSYGPGFNPTVFDWQSVEGHPDGGRYVPRVFRQFEHLVKEIRENPHLSTHKISPWLPQFCLQHSELQRKVVVAPCHGDIQVTILGDKLSLTMNQRSGDYPVGVPADIMMYGALTIMLAHVTGYVPHRLIHRVTDAHYYENQVPYVDMMLERPSYPFPTLRLTEEGLNITDIFDFRTHHFELYDYEHGPAIPEMPVTE